MVTYTNLRFYASFYFSYLLLVNNYCLSDAHIYVIYNGYIIDNYYCVVLTTFSLIIVWKKDNI